MNEEAQRIAIAEASGLEVPCGGSEPEYVSVHTWGDWQQQKKPFPFQFLQFRKCQKCRAIHIYGEQLASIERESELPNYLNDLNAMHEAEKTLRIGVDLHIGQRWFGYLANVVSGKQMYLNEYDWPGAAYFICRATAKQRAEAFLRTIGKWEDGK